MAASQFRLLALMCSFAAARMSDLLTTFLRGQLISNAVLANDRFEEQTSILTDKFHTTRATGINTARFFQLLMMLIGQGRLESGLHTDAFVSNIPGTDQFLYNTNFYPRYDNSTFDAVSTCATTRPWTFSRA